MRKLKVLVACLVFAQAGTVYAEDLLTIYQQALEADPQLKTAELKVEIGSAQKGQALGQMLPQIIGNANWSTNGQRRREQTDAVWCDQQLLSRYPV